MIDHTSLGVTDPAKSRYFYQQALAPLGYRALIEVPTEHTGGVVVLGAVVRRRARRACSGGPSGRRR
jgi:hypothetical protein